MSTKELAKSKSEITKGDDKNIIDIRKGALFGEMALIDKQPRSAIARAVDEVVVKEIDKTALSSQKLFQTANMMQQLTVMQEMQMKAIIRYQL